MRTGGDGRPASAVRVPREADNGSYASTPAVRRRMQRQRTRDTTPELAIRKVLHAKGWRYRVDRAPLRGLRRRADIVFGPAKLAIFVDGCFWHGCEQHRPNPSSSNRDYWVPKIERNRARDADTDRRLHEAGWEVLRVWEHDPPEAVVARIEELLAIRHPGRSRDDA